MENGIGNGLSLSGAGDSFDHNGELERETSKIEQEALNRKIKLGKANEFILSVINNCARNGAKYLDLSRKNLSSIPEELLTLTHVENLYLEGNNISILPEDFFLKLPCLRWLDLRNNGLMALPSAYIGSHQYLTNLLIQGNKLQTLPLELGEVTTLTGLNIGDNPLRFPTKDIISQGVVEILKYLRLMLLSKSNGSFRSGSQLNGSSSSPSANGDGEHAGSDSDEDPFSGKRIRSRPKSGLRERPQSAKAENSELYGKPASLHKQQSYQELKRERTEKIKRAGAMGKFDRQLSTSTISSKRSTMDVNLYPEPPAADMIDMKVKERQQQAIMREKNEKIDAILQRRKDEEKLKRFREDAKIKQRQKDYEKYMNGGKLDYTEPGELAPFDIADEDMKMMTNEERIKKGVKEQHERIRQILSPRALKQMEEEKLAKDEALKDKIKEHTESMKVRRKKNKGNPQEEMEAAIKELEIAKRLQQELDKRRRNLDYRFKAYNPP